MIISRIIGGLGNQMFQYAAGLNLSTHHGTALKLDIADLGPDPESRLELAKLHTNLSIASSLETAPYRDHTLVHRIRMRLRPPHLRKPYKEPGYPYDPHFHEAGADTYLKGYWQSWKYAEPVRDILLRQFRVREELASAVADTAKAFRDGNTVSVHIRRGDYATPEALRYHGLLDATYYNAALEKIGEMHPGVEVRFFSDDINWVKEHVRTRLRHEYVTGRLSRTAIEDFHLMQHCRHHIIANSSFSWWAAWLNPSEEKTVIAPKRWFAEAKNDTRDMLPPGWIRV
jgi:hypothetical protein